MKRFFIFFLFFLSCISCFAQEDIWNPTPQLPNNYIGPNKLKNIYLSAGPTTKPTFIDHGSNVITVNACCISLFDNAEHRGLPKQYNFGPATFTLNVDATNYIVGNYNNGNPILQNINDVDLINESNIVPILTIYDKNGFLHSLNWDTVGKGLANKLHQRFVKTDRYRRESGLTMTMSNPGTNLNFTISEGRVWYGATRELIPAINSTADIILIVYPNGTTSATTTLNNMNYYSGSLQTLTNNRYAVNWVYRGVEQQKHVYIMLGSGDYSLTEAQTAIVPAAPSIITSHAQLIAKVIIQKGLNTVTSLQSAYDITFNLAAPQVHNELSGLNDGDSYEHLTAIEKSQALVGSSSVDWAGKVVTVFDSIKNATGTAAAPTYSFASDPNTGIYSPAADNLGVSVGGVQVATFASTGLGLTSPLTISNGGTGKTTAAEALAALGGASLNGSSTVDFATQRSTVSNQVINTDGYSRTSGSFSYSAVIGSLGSSAAYNIDFNLAANGGFFAETLTNLQFNSGKQAGGCWYSTAAYNATTGLSGLVTQQTVDLDDSQLLAVTWSQPAVNTLRLTLTNNHTATIYGVAIMVRIASDRASIMTFKSKG